MAPLKLSAMREIARGEGRLRLPSEWQGPVVRPLEGKRCKGQKGGIPLKLRIE